MSAPPPPPPAPVIKVPKATTTTTTVPKGMTLEEKLKQRKGPEVVKQPVVIDLKQASKTGKPLRIIVMSDTHNSQKRLTLPPGDIFLHCGDATDDGNESEITAFNEWLGTLPYKHKICICGNHESKLSTLSKEALKQKYSNAILLVDESIHVEGIHIYGSPWTPNLGKHEKHMLGEDNTGFYKSFDDLQQVWQMIPQDVHILMTHTPPHQILDGKSQYGCPHLKARVQTQLPVLQLHCFGHIHADYGHKQLNNVTYINAAMDQDEQCYVLDYFV